MPHRLTRHPSRILPILACCLGLVLAAGGGWASAGLGERTTGTLGERSSPVSGAHDRFLPISQAYQPTVSLDEAGRLHVQWQIADGYYLYRHAFVARGDGQALALDLPEGLHRHDEYFGDVETYHGSLAMTLTLPAHPLAVTLKYQGCADAGLCYPPATLAWQVDPAQHRVQASTAAAPTAAGPAPAVTSPGLGLGLAALFAFCGGLILNLMPCVFPILSLKVLTIATHAHHRGSTLAHALAYAAGVIGSFLLAAMALLVLRGSGHAIGWGFQLQSPPVVAALAWLFTGIGLVLSGVFTPGFRWMGMGQSLTEGPGPAASFFTGTLAVVVASPCTAPFMAAALGFALVQPAPVTLAVFTSLGAGMAAPFVLLGLLPGLARCLPRPGPWMETFKQWLALPVYATVLWLLWVLGHQSSPYPVAAVVIGCLTLAPALWLLEHARAGKPWLRAAAIAGLLASALPALTITANGPAIIHGDGDSQPWSTATLDGLRQQNRLVFLNVTADWCITCLANEKLVLDTPAARALFREHHVAYLKADWTRHDAAIGELLAGFGRSGIPLYAVYPPATGPGSAEAPRVLPQLLTLAALEEAITSADSGK